MSLTTRKLTKSLYYLTANGSVSGATTKLSIVFQASTALCCGKPVRQNPGRKQKRFCSDICRNKWWNSHLDLVKRKANYEIVCLGCEKPFVVYGNANRKYCSHKCYVEHRFGGKENE